MGQVKRFSTVCHIYEFFLYSVVVVYLIPKINIVPDADTQEVAILFQSLWKVLGEYPEPARRGVFSK